MLKCFVVAIAALATGASCLIAEPPEPSTFSPERDLLSLHYDHAPDKDDGHSAVADAQLLEAKFGGGWIERNAVAVSGAYGENAPRFDDASDAVMDATFTGRGGWLDAHTDRDGAFDKLLERWLDCLDRGGDVWVKEGGQSDITADVVRAIRERKPDVDTRRRVHVVQHSDWNEDKTTDEDLAYTKANTHYVRIPDANRYLNVRGGNRAFEAAALADPEFGAAWRAAFDYYPPRERLDFSDTGELLHIVGIGELGIDAFRERFLAVREE